MNIKRILAVIISVVMLFTLAACGEKENGGKGTNGDLSSAEVDAITFEGLKFETNPDLDFGGKKIVVARDTVPKTGVSALYDRELAIKAAIEEKYNVVIEYLEYGAHENALTNVVLNHMSGTSWADIVFNISNVLLQTLTNDGIYRALDDYIDFSNDRFKMTSAATQYVDGKHYSYYPIQNEQGYCVYYSTDLIAENNCDDPKELYEAGEWNWDNFQKIAKACTGMRSGKTVYGVAGSNIVDGLMASNGMSVISADTKNNKVACNLFNDAGKNVLDFIRTLAYENKAVDSTYGSHNGIETFKNNLSAMLIGPVYYGSHITKSDIPFDMVPMPIGPDTDSYTNVCQYCYCYSIPATSSYKTEELLQIAFELERNDPAIEGTYRTDDYEGRLQAYVDQYLDQGNNYIDDAQTEFVFDFINDEEVDFKVDWVTDDLKAIIATEIYLPIYKGEDVRSHLTSVKPVIDAALKESF